MTDRQTCLFSFARTLARARTLFAAVLAAALGSAVHASPGVTIEPNLERAIHAMVDEQVLGSAVPAISRVEVSFGQLDPRIRLTPCERMEPFMPPGQRLWGAARVGVRCVQGQRPWQVFLPVTVQVWGQALVTATAVAAGQVLTEADLAWQEVDWAASPAPVFTEPGDVVGRSAVRALPAGETLRTHLVRAPLLFPAGAPVQLKVAGAGFSVSAEGRALNQGLEGETVRVRLDSGRIVQGVAVDARTVEVRI